MNKRDLFGVSLTGGGARGSYQAGVLKGLSEILSEQKLVGVDNPFKLWSGVSAGSINAALCCSGLDNFDNATTKLVELWNNIRPEDVYLTDFGSISKNGMRWLRDLTFGSAFKSKLAKSLLDTKPLLPFLEKNISFANINKNIDAGFLTAIACSAYDYKYNRTVAFIQGKESFEWDRPRRISRQTKINAKHVMASCAIPILFPTAKIDDQFFGDGSFRNMSPISPVVRMGANKILVVSVREEIKNLNVSNHSNPSLAKIGGAILDALFLDTVDIDLERISHINELVEAAKGSVETKRSDYSPIDCVVIRPSVDVGLLAAQKAKSFPKLIDFLMQGLGSVDESAELASYILFVSSFTRDLVEIGYMDAMEQKNNLLKWLEV